MFLLFSYLDSKEKVMNDTIRIVLYMYRLNFCKVILRQVDAKTIYTIWSQTKLYSELKYVFCFWMISNTIY